MKKLRFYKKLLIEVIEMLCTICLYLSRENSRGYSRTPYGSYFGSHFTELKGYSEELRESIGEKKTPAKW